MFLCWRAARILVHGESLWPFALLGVSNHEMAHSPLFICVSLFSALQVVRGSHRPPINKKWPKPWSELMQVRVNSGPCGAVDTFC